MVSEFSGRKRYRQYSCDISTYFADVGAPKLTVQLKMKYFHEWIT